MRIRFENIRYILKYFLISFPNKLSGISDTLQNENKLRSITSHKLDSYVHLIATCFGQKSIIIRFVLYNIKKIKNKIHHLMHIVYDPTQHQAGDVITYCILAVFLNII